ncbi:MAG: glycosyltransferase [Clostridia bacterium]|nr:glycosyltransferase [Clostridia bacterium]
MDNINNVLVSVIVPVYNVENYLERCFDSLLNQTLKNIEIIAVDDGSTDTSGKILDEFAQTDSRVKVVHTTNRGVSSARNTGIDMATGKYIGFVDPDDYVAYDMYEYMSSECENCNYDMVQCNYRFVYDDGSQKIHVDIPDSILSGSKEILKGFMNDFIVPSCAIKIFKKDILGKLRFKEDLPVAEDKLLVALFLDMANSVKTSSKICYFYYQRNNSVTYEKLNDKHFADIEVFSEFAKSNKNSGTLSDIIVRCHLAEKSLHLIEVISKTDTYTEKLGQLRKVLKNNLKSVFKSPKFSLKDRIAVVIICLWPGLFKWIYKKYLSHRLTRV